jgi:Peptidase propeptide and YPEB domain
MATAVVPVRQADRHGHVDTRGKTQPTIQFFEAVLFLVIAAVGGEVEWDGVCWLCQACLNQGTSLGPSVFYWHVRQRSYAMPTIRRILLGLVISATTLSSGPVFADRPPTPQERSQIEAILRNEGFTHWGEIELDDDLWQVDDAYASDGRRYDLKLDPDTLSIVEREPD